MAASSLCAGMTTLTPPAAGASPSPPDNAGSLIAGCKLSMIARTLAEIRRSNSLESTNSTLPRPTLDSDLSARAAHFARNIAMPPALCRLCSSPELAPHLEIRASRLDRCRSCGFVQVREQPTPEELRALYGDGYFGRGKYDDE